MRDQYQAGLKLLLIAAACVLLVACGNLANLMLARGLKERSQTSLCVALGASRGRLVRKALSESILLAVIGGIFAIGVAYGGSKLILYLAFHNGGGPANYVPVDASPSWPVLLFALAVARRRLYRAKIAGDRPSDNVARPAFRRCSAWPEPAQSRTPEFWFRDKGPFSRLN
jgi:hypothetical protein